MQFNFSAILTSSHFSSSNHANECVNSSFVTLSLDTSSFDKNNLSSSKIGAETIQPTTRCKTHLATVERLLDGDLQPVGLGGPMNIGDAITATRVEVGF